MLLRLEGLDAAYGPIDVLFGIDLDVGDREIVALLGTNGAGKTTILRVISGVLKGDLFGITLEPPGGTIQPTVAPFVAIPAT